MDKLDFITLTEEWSRIPLLVCLSAGEIWNANLNVDVTYTSDKEAVLVTFDSDTHTVKLMGTKQLGYINVTEINKETGDEFSNCLVEFNKYAIMDDMDNFINLSLREAGGLKV